MLLSIVSERLRSQSSGKGGVKNRIWICGPYVSKIPIGSNTTTHLRDLCVNLLCFVALCRYLWVLQRTGDGSPQIRGVSGR